MTLLLAALAIIGAIAVVSFAVFLVLNGRNGASTPAARGVLVVSTVAAGACAALGVLIAFIGE